MPAGCRSARRAFTLIEILIVVVILGILAAMVVPQFTNASDETNDAAARRNLQIIRHQIELFRAQTLQDPDMIGGQWNDLLQGNYLHSIPQNPFNHNFTIAAAPGLGVGWVWRNTGTGIMQIYATDSTSAAEFLE